MKYKIAVASTDGKVVNQHFGRAKAFELPGYIEDSVQRLLSYIEVRKLLIDI